MRSAYTEHAHLEGEVRIFHAQDQQVTTRIPRIVTECLLTRSVLIKIYAHNIYSRFHAGTILSIRKHEYYCITLSNICWIKPIFLASVCVVLY